MRHIVNCDKVIVTPDVKTVDLVRRRKPVLESLCFARHAEVPEDWACVLGSDGIFDALSDQATAKARVWDSRMPSLCQEVADCLACQGGSRQGCRQANRQ